METELLNQINEKEKTIVYLQSIIKTYRDKETKPEIQQKQVNISIQTETKQIQEKTKSMTNSGVETNMSEINTYTGDNAKDDQENTSKKSATGTEKEQRNMGCRKIQKASSPKIPEKIRSIRILNPKLKK
ncbi:hypothetical protein JTB14_009802 [Gonioctena quinquepunctata]|nr:hypothetical protein JTB14_009802 [Gonioctena quinquepunctata]